MKTNATVRIILFSLAFVVLLGLLLAGIAAKTIVDRGVKWDSAPAQVVTDPNGEPDVFTAYSQLRDIEIQWALGTITVQTGDVEQVTYQETPVSDSRYAMVTNISQDDLEIRFCQEEFAGFNFSLFGTDIDLSKDLTVTLPRDMALDSLEIDAAATEVILKGLTVREVSLNTASGMCQMDDCSVIELDVNTASGNVRFSGSLEVLEFDAASAEFSGILTNTPRSLSIDSMSGDIDITLPADAGFTACMDALSSEFSSDFETTVRNGDYICGDGSCRIEFNGMSGDLIIRKGA